MKAWRDKTRSVLLAVAVAFAVAVVVADAVLLSFFMSLLMLLIVVVLLLLLLQFLVTGGILYSCNVWWLLLSIGSFCQSVLVWELCESSPAVTRLTVYRRPQVPRRASCRKVCSERSTWPAAPAHKNDSQTKPLYG